MSDVSETDFRLDDLSTLSTDGCLSENAGSETDLLKSDGEISAIEPRHSGKHKRLNKSRRQRIRKKLSGMVLGAIEEEPGSSSTIATKRARVAAGSTPEMVEKKLRTYAQTVIESKVRKFCVRENNTNLVLDDQKLKLFRTELGLRVLESAKSAGFVPQMLGCYLADGVIVCKCTNDETFNWFRGELDKMKDIWDGCQLSIGDPPKPLLLHTWVPGPPENAGVATANIGVMNPNVSIDLWKVVRYKREATRLSIVYRVDRKSFDFIAGSGSSLQYVLERIHFRVISGP